MPNSQIKRSTAFLWAFCGILVLVAGCVRPAPNPAYPEPSARVGAMEAVNPYPGPEVNDEVEYCRGAVEIPIAVWADGQYLYSQLCGVATAGSQLIIRNGEAIENASGSYVETQWPCIRYVHYPSLNGSLVIEAIMTDAGGQTLCDVAFIEREWQIFPIVANNVNIWERTETVKVGR